MLDRIGAAIEAWDAAREKGWYRVSGLLLGVAVGVGISLWGGSTGLQREGQLALAVLATMSVWWVGGVMPLTVTALVPMLAFPALNILPFNKVAPAYMDTTNALMLGGFVLGHAIEEVGLHERFVAALLQPAPVRQSPRRVLLALMLATGLLSGVMSNTAAMLVVTPLAASLAAIAVPAGRARTAFPLGCAYAANIGGLLTPIGTPPNAVLVGLAPDYAGRGVTFAQWLIVGVPVVAILLPMAWVAIAWLAVPVPGRAEQPIEAPAARPWRPGEAGVLAVLVLALVAWITRVPIELGPVTVPGWGELLHIDDDGWVAIFAAFSLFFVPAGRDERGEVKTVITWQSVQKAVPWGVLLLLGGGIAVAAALKAHHVTEWLAAYGTGLGAFPAIVGTLILCAGMVLLTEFVSNTSAAQIAVPVVAAAAIGAGVAPLEWMIAAAMAASCGFMMPAGTGPNAIATEVGGVRPADMAYAGLIVDVGCAVVVAVVVHGLIRFV